MKMWKQDTLFYVPFWKNKIDNFKDKKKDLLELLKDYPEKPTELQTFTTNRGINIVDQFCRIFADELNAFATSIEKHLRLTDVWSTSYKTVQYHPYHNHGDAGLSGILYLDLKEKMPNTIFVNSNPTWVTGKTQYHEMVVEEGDMVIVPSHVGHFTAPNLSKKTKRIVAFDLRFER